MHGKSTAAILAAVLGATLVACGGSSGPVAGPTLTPTVASSGTTLLGTVVGADAVASTAAFAAHAAGEIVVFVVEDPSITATVGADGAFVLGGLPGDGFTLAFASDGQDLGTLTFEGLRPNQEVEITVEVVDGSLTLLEERRDGIGHGDVEVEGLVELVIQLDPAGESYFLVDGLTVLAMPGVTAVREGSAGRSVEDVAEGQRVHVKGVWLAPEGQFAEQTVLAHEIKLQDDDEGVDAPDEEEAKVTICHKGKNTLTISISAWPAHQGHGDTMGACQ